MTNRHGPEMDGAQDALNKMRRAHQRGTGCRLTAAEIESLSLSIIGQMWDDIDPREVTQPSPIYGHTGHP